MTSSASSRQAAQQRRTIDLTIRLVLLGGLVAFCLVILSPFLLLMLWAGIIAAALSSPYEALVVRLGGRRKLAAGLVTLGMLGALALPGWLLTDSLIDGAQALQARGYEIPPPPDSVQTWPLVGRPLAGAWRMASTNLKGLLESLAPQLKEAATWVLGAALESGLAALKLTLSILLAGVFLAQAETLSPACYALAVRVADEHGRELTDLARDTTRSVARGVLGVSLIQAVLLGIGFALAGIPAAGLLALICLILCVVQIGPGVVTVPVLVWAFSRDHGPGTVVFAVWTVLATLIDTPLKPILLGRGARVPMLVIFLGALGGLFSFGFIGLFVGSVVLSVGFRLYQAWLGTELAASAGPDPARPEPPAPTAPTAPSVPVASPAPAASPAEDPDPAAPA